MDSLMDDIHTHSQNLSQEHATFRVKRWRALALVCLATLMIVLDTTIVNVALPSIKLDLGFDDISLAWIVNAYLLAFGGFLLLGGRLGDLYGQRNLFIAGVGVFTVASLACGLAPSQGALIAARGLQGLGGALVTATALSLIINLFTDPVERAKAIGAYSFVCAGGGSIGVLLGGALTHTYDWHSIFLVNLPTGVVVLALACRLLPPAEETRRGSLDVAGAVTIISTLISAVYAIMNGNQAGWGSPTTLGLLALAAVMFMAFIGIERRVREPLVPLRLFRLRNLSTANLIGVLWATSMFAWFFLCALYLQQVLGYTPLEVGLAFLPANLVMAVCSLSLSSWLIIRYGIKLPLVLGLALAAGGLLLLSRAVVNGDFLLDVLPGMLLLGLGAGMAFNPVLVAAMNDVAPSESGLASGIVNTSFMMGGALGLAIISSLASYHRDALMNDGVDPLAALSGGYGMAFLVGALLALLASLIGAVYLRK
ncbi:DHA2 family efflux MFS transporter permease subunit [Pseudomonas yamanorum]|jgi:EmrB/QacA subfamily drug resistance transporter|uniref:DHA2 family efflux MFS transporter permease subunit n=2 Tax=Pseudomonas yamanorum TaxID=515393 RepID=UPI003B9EFBEF